MEYMEYIYDSLLNWVFGLLPFSSRDLKDMFINAGLLHIWELFRDYIFSYKVWILGVLPCLFLERLFPAMRTRGSRQALFYDGLVYPIAGGAMILPFVEIFVT